MVAAGPLSAPQGLVFAMVLVSAAGRNMTNSELHTIGRIVTQAPALDGFDTSGVSGIANC